jgi:hypothetical protein
MQYVLCDLGDFRNNGSKEQEKLHIFMLRFDIVRVIVQKYSWTKGYDTMLLM